jgi:hypothetical protein
VLRQKLGLSHYRVPRITLVQGETIDLFFIGAQLI